MYSNLRSALLLSFFALASCGGSSGGEFGPIDPFTTELNATSDIVSISNDNVTFDLTRDVTYDRGTFIAGSNPGDGLADQVLAFSETDDTFAAFLKSNADGVSADVFIGRRTPIGALPTGSATLTGTYVGTINEPDPVAYDFYIAGDTTLEVDFADMTVSGSIKDRTSPLFSLVDAQGERLLFNLSVELYLDETRLSSDGTFRGTVTSIDTSEDGETIDSAGEYAGFLGGENATEGVGRILINMPATEAQDSGFITTPALPATQEVGVFAVGHEQ